jgi:hypothetical protein
MAARRRARTRCRTASPWSFASAPTAKRRLEVSVTFDERRGYVASAPELRTPVMALSLGGLLRRIDAALMPDAVDIKLVLDRAARLERDQRRRGGVR